MTTSTSILESPLLRIEIIDRILSTPDLAPTKLAELLSSKIHILTNNHNHRDPEKQLVILETRLRLAKTYLEVIPRKVVEAESELTVIEGECKRFIKFGFRASNGDGGDLEGGDGAEMERKRVEWKGRVEELRKDGLRVLVGVEEGLGREGRAKRWRELLNKLEEADKDGADTEGHG